MTQLELVMCARPAHFIGNPCICDVGHHHSKQYLQVLLHIMFYINNTQSNKIIRWANLCKSEFVTRCCAACVHTGPVPTFTRGQRDTVWTEVAFMLTILFVFAIDIWIHIILLIQQVHLVLNFYITLHSPRKVIRRRN